MFTGRKLHVFLSYVEIDKNSKNENEIRKLTSYLWNGMGKVFWWNFKWLALNGEARVK